MSHTLEPWHSDFRQIEDDNGALIATLSGWKGDAENKANMRRIVACVNACKGIKTESLEMEVLSWITDKTGENPLQRERDELLEARRACGERLIEVLKERDELLAGRLIEEPLRRQLDELRDEVEYHRTDAKKWALQALKFDKWQPIETAPKIGKHLATMKNGAVSVVVWLDADCPDADEAGWYEHWNFDKVEPTHWMPLPQLPLKVCAENAE